MLKVLVLAAATLLAGTSPTYAQAIKEEVPAPRQPRAPVPGPNAEPGIPHGVLGKEPDFSVQENMPEPSYDQVAAAGTKLIGENGDTLGTVENIILDRQGKVVALIVGVDKFLGLTEDRLELRWDQVRFERKDTTVSFVTALSKDELRNQAKLSPPRRQGG